MIISKVFDIQFVDRSFLQVLATKPANSSVKEFSIFRKAGYAELPPDKILLTTLYRKKLETSINTLYWIIPTKFSDRPHNSKQLCVVHSHIEFYFNELTSGSTIVMGFTEPTGATEFIVKEWT
jgi:hypothetical protein